jgi:hypothetical protein
MLTYSDLDVDQLGAIEFGLDGEDALYCADVGTGKTAIGLTIAQEATDVHRWLVLAPLLVATDTWAREPAQWEHLDSKDIVIACGTAEQRKAAIKQGKPLTVINYENLPWLMEQFPATAKKGDGQFPFDGLICDEIDKLKNVSSNRFKLFRNRLKHFKKRIGLTGTFMPTNLTDVWGQAYVIDGGHSFGRSFYDWRRQYFYPTDFQQHNWAPHHTTRQYVIDQLADLVYRLKAKGLAEVVFETPTLLKMEAEQRRRYDVLERDYFLAVEDAHGLSREVDAVNAAVLTGKLQQITAGFSYVDGGKEAIWHDTGRFTWLSNLLGRYPRDQMLIFYHYNEELDQIKRMYPDIHHLGKGVSVARALNYIWQWNTGQIQHLCLHPQSAGHGLNLQKSGAHHIAFLTLPWSGGLLKQVVGRLARRGNVAPQIFVHAPMYEHTIDTTVYDVLSGRLIGMESFLDDLEQAIAARSTY